MKKLYLFILLVPSLSFAQKFEQVEGLFTMQFVANSDLSKAQLFDALRSWFVSTYKSSTDVLEISDKESGVLMGKGLSHINIINRLNMNDTKRMRYTIKVEIKDNRFRTTFFNVLYIDDPAEYNRYTTSETSAEVLLQDKYLFNKQGKPKVFMTSLKTGAEEKFISLHDSMIQYLSSTLQNSDW
jgi:hypothetical protein